MSRISEGFEATRTRILAAAKASSRAPEGIRLLAVSKGHPAAAIREAYALGQRAFGENYAQELAAKAAELADLPGIEWHMIGHLQRNKAKLLARVVHVVETVDSVELARELGFRIDQLGRPPLPVLIEVNVAGEVQKHGCSIERVGAVVQAIRETRGLVLKGLMTVPPEGDVERTRLAFRSLASLRAAHGAEYLPELSMGMSGDLEIAVAEGATWVRIGTAIFGERVKNREAT